jgi:hypothetical protein
VLGTGGLIEGTSYSTIIPMDVTTVRFTRRMKISLSFCLAMLSMVRWLR